MAPRSIRRAGLRALLLPLLAQGIHATTYSLYQSYSGATFYNNWNFVTSDPSGGWVTYVNQGDAQSSGLAYADNTGAYMGVDYKNTYPTNGPGRKAVRIESKQSFTKGLFIGDFSHMPTGCGLWPAFWMYGPNWPNNGEIDIIEGVNTQSTNQISGHTSNGCTISGSNSQAKFYQSNCYQPQTNSGCYFIDSRSNLFGSGFNSNGGGVYAMEWTDNYINVWGFPRNAIPSDITNRSPNTANWGTPMAQFSGSGCNIDSHFNSMNIVINTDFCGPWAGAVYGQQGCPGDCNSYVGNNPSAFQNAYWHINSVNVYYVSNGGKAYVHNTATNNTNLSPDTTASPVNLEYIEPLASQRPIYQPPSAEGSTQHVVYGPPADEAMPVHLAGRVR